MLRRAALLLALPLLTAFAIPAQSEASRTILVLDGSGSMWGQINGEPKITIAQRVIGDLLASIPAEQELGLYVYGHRRKGDCGDIELMVAPGPDTRAAIQAAVDGISPKGKTPLSAAVIAAAEALKYGEEAATVILVSDGRETCELDPCAVGQQLEETGVGFTAHVIGFDVTAAEDRAQLQCLAENTGGRFLTASNAEELSEALAEVSAPAVPEPPATLDMVFTATDGVGGPVLRSGLIWTLTNTDTGQDVLAGFEVPDLRISLAPGPYRATVIRKADEAEATLELTVAEDASREIVLALASSTPPATVAGPAAAPAGSTIAVTWTGPNEEGDFIVVVAPDAADAQSINYSYTRDGSPLALVMPPEPGSYELRYLRRDGRQVLARQPIEATALAVTLTAPETAQIGAAIAVQWTGPDYKNDYIAVSQLDDQDARQINYSYTRDGTPLMLTMPAEPGTYEIRYVLAQDRTVIARRPVTVEAAEVTLAAPDTAIVGANVIVQWQGPDERNDYIAVARPDAPGNQQETYSYTRDGMPLQLQMPSEPGTYEIRYVLAQGRTILATRPVEVTEVSATLAAPATAPAGATVTVTWEGPDYRNDYIAVSRPDDPGNRQETYSYTRDGKPLQLQMPSEPGSYEIRYVMAQNRRVIARTPVTVDEVTASLTAPSTAKVGEPVIVQWEGPDYRNDYIAVARTDDPGNRHVTYTYTRDGAPLRLAMPPEPGSYEIRYIQSQGRKILAAQTIEIADIEIFFDMPNTGKAGERLRVDWVGPDYQNDYIAIARADAPDNQQESYTRTREGSPLLIDLPDTPGVYELRYVMNQGRRVLGRAEIIVE
ncbi:MAG: VWA domain-containing protein [Pseudomonadota bacterium]